MSFVTTDKKRNKKITSGFTLIEVILTLVLILLISSLIIPNISQSQKNFKLISSAKNIEKICKFARGMSILREKELIVIINLNKEKISVGEANNIVDYVEDEFALKQIKINEEIVRNFPKEIEIEKFLNEDNSYIFLDDDYYYMKFYPNGHCDPFSFNLKLKDKTLNISSDPITGKIISKYVQ